MKKNLFMLLIAYSLLSFSSYAMNDDGREKVGDMYIKMGIFPKRKGKIYKEIVSNSGLAKSREAAEIDNYHLTIGQIKGAQGTEEGEMLRSFLLQEHNEKCEHSLNKDHAIILQDVYADRYTVNRQYHNCPIALFLVQETADLLKSYNKILNDALENFNKQYATNYRMGEDLTPSNFTPHITLADKNWINQRCMGKRDKIIETLNNNIAKAKNQNPKGTYDFMLIVPRQ